MAAPTPMSTASSVLATDMASPATAVSGSALLLRLRGAGSLSPAGLTSRRPCRPAWRAPSRAPLPCPCRRTAGPACRRTACRRPGRSRVLRWSRWFRSRPGRYCRRSRAWRAPSPWAWLVAWLVAWLLLLLLGCSLAAVLFQPAGRAAPPAAHRVIAVPAAVADLHSPSPSAGKLDIVLRDLPLV